MKNMILGFICDREAHMRLLVIVHLVCISNRNSAAPQIESIKSVNNANFHSANRQNYRKTSLNCG